MSHHTATPLFAGRTRSPVMSNFLLHKHCKPDEQFKRPEGLTELLCDITREVLREQPDCVYTFCADYLDAMLLTREQTLIAERTRNSIFAISMTISDLMREIGIPADLANRSADLIEQSFRLSIVNDQHDDVRLQQPESTAVLESDILEQLRTQCGFSGDQLTQVQRIIQACFKDYYFREKEFTLKMNRLPYDHWANQVEKTLDLYRHSGPERHELERAAVAIQAAYRSYYSRKMQRDLLVQGKMATTIQASYRGHLTRRRLADAKADEIAEKTAPAPLPPPPRTAARAAVPTRAPAPSRVDVQDSFIAAQIEKMCRTATGRADDGEEPNLDQMATTIQASFRGHLARKQLLAEKHPTEHAIAVSDVVSEAEEVVHIDVIHDPGDVVEIVNVEEEQKQAAIDDTEQNDTETEKQPLIVNVDEVNEVAEPENPISAVDEAGNNEPSVIVEEQPDEMVNDEAAEVEQA